MKTSVQISEHVSDNSARRALVFKDANMENTPYSVSAFNDSGSSFCVSFSNLQLAEDFAEDWVLDK